mgnify:CR=1 FL=1
MWYYFFEKGHLVLRIVSICVALALALFCGACAKKRAPDPPKSRMQLTIELFEALDSGVGASEFAHGFTEVLAAEVSKVKGIHVISPSTVRRYRRLWISAAMMARILGVQVIVEGTVQQSGDRLTVTTRLTDVHSGKLIWAENLDVPAADLATGRMTVARAVATAVGERVTRPAR